MTTIAILGANGRLGRAVGKAFVEAGYDAVSYTHLTLPTNREV